MTTKTKLPRSNLPHPLPFHQRRSPPPPPPPPLSLSCVRRRGGGGGGAPHDVSWTLLGELIHVSTSSNHQISGLYWRFGYQQAPSYLDNMTRILPTRQQPSEEHIRSQEIIQPLPWDVLRFTLWNPPTRHGKSWDHDRYFYFYPSTQNLTPLPPCWIPTVPPLVPQDSGIRSTTPKAKVSFGLMLMPNGDGWNEWNLWRK